MARTRKAGKPWTGAEDKIIVKLVKQGVPTRKMASALGRTSLLPIQTGASILKSRLLVRDTTATTME